MPRPPRYLLSRTYYHIMTRGNNKKPIFHRKEDYDYYLGRLAAYKNEHPFNLYHYCLMPNHTHFLIQTQNAADFAKFMKKLNLSYFNYYQRQYGWTGHLWQGRYKSQPVGKDDYFIQCGKYIELNPVRKGLVDAAENYPYSSYRHYYLGQPNDLIATDKFYESLGMTDIKRRRKYNRLIIGEKVMKSYKKGIWSGSRNQTNNEQEKLRYHRSR